MRGKVTLLYTVDVNVRYLSIHGFPKVANGTGKIDLFFSQNLIKIFLTRMLGVNAFVNLNVHITDSEDIFPSKITSFTFSKVACRRILIFNFYG